MREYLITFIMAVKKSVKSKLPKKEVVEVISTVPVKPIKGPHHIVKDGEIILDPNFVNPGVFSSNA